MRRIFDISPPISEALAVWPGDTPLRREVLLDMNRGDKITLSCLHGTPHLGAHADGPNHYGRGARGIDARPLDDFLGPCQLNASNRDQRELDSMTGPEQVQLRWRNVARWAWPFVIVSLLVAGLFAADAWLPLFPREPGRRLTELFLRSLLIAYMSVVVLIPLVLAVSVWLLIRARRRGKRRPWLARLVLACGSAGLALLGLELAASAWLAWVHRLPHLPTEFPRSATASDELSLVVIGGSSAMGYPYNPSISIGQIVAWQLEQARPGRRVNLDIRANLGRNLEDMHKELATLQRRPDALIIFSGHNEFLSRFETNRDAGYSEAPAGTFLYGLYQLSLHSPFCLWVYETVRKHRLGGPPPALNHHLLIDVPAFTPSELLQILTDFRRRLEAIVAYCEQIGAVPILVIPASNESGFEPNRTVLSARVSQAECARLTEQFQQARALETDDPAQSQTRYRSLLDRQPDFAEAHFRLGRLLEQGGAFEEAREHYIQARDLDGFPVRCRSDLAQIHRDVAARHNSILVDGSEVLRARSRHGILDDELFHDAHHPSLASHLNLAQAVLDQLHQRRFLGLGGEGAPAPIIDPAECASRFQIDFQVWAAACVKAGLYFKHLSAARYDFAERVAKQLRFERAALQIREGLRLPEQVGIPGVGLPPPVSYRWDWWAESPGAASSSPPQRPRRPPRSASSPRPGVEVDQPFRSYPPNQPSPRLDRHHPCLSPRRDSTARRRCFTIKRMGSIAG